MLPSKPCNKKKDEKKRYAPPCEFVSLLLLAHFFGAIRTMVAQRETSSEQSKQALLVAAFFLFFLSPLYLYIFGPLVCIFALTFKHVKASLVLAGVSPHSRAEAFDD